MGIRAIEYRPWKGDRTDPNRRWLVISNHVFKKNIRSAAVIILLVIGMMLAHALPIIFAIVSPHEEITNEDMVGEQGVFEPGSDPEHDYNVTNGTLFITGDLRINGNFTVVGSVSFGGELFLDNGSLNGSGFLEGDYNLQLEGDVNSDGYVSLRGYMSLGVPEELHEWFPPGTPPEFIEEIIGNLSKDGISSINGTGSIIGYGLIIGNGTVNGTAEPEVPDEFTMGNEGYLTNGVIIIFTMLLAAIICADIISSDLANSSFVLYFSRPVRALDYLLGKFVGLMWVMWVFCLIPPIAYVLVMMGTQTGDDFSGGLKILGLTVVAGLVTAIYFLPYGLMISSFTKSKAYAGIGIFMSFFVLSIIAGIFSESSDMWSLIDPFELLHNFYQILFDGTIPEGIEAWQVGASILAFTLIPMAIVVVFIHRKGAGK